MTEGLMLITKTLCIDGKGEGFGNQTSIQTVAIGRAARAVRRAYSVDSGMPVPNPYSFLCNQLCLYISLRETNSVHRPGLYVT